MIYSEFSLLMNFHLKRALFYNAISIFVKEY